VLGYQDEPYLRVGPDGVFENVRSPATYLNRDRRATTPVPGSADAEAEPEWRKVGGGTVVRWHDHRTHWMGEQDPAAVRAAPDVLHVVIPDWVVPMRHDGTRIEATGDLVWIPGPSAWPWLAIGVAGLVLTLGLAATRRWTRWLAVLLGLLITLDVVHGIGVGLSKSGSAASKLGTLLAGSYLSIAGWALGVAGVVLLLRRRPEGAIPAACAGLFVAVNGGLADLSSLTRSQLPFAGPADLARIAVATSLGIGSGLLVAGPIRLMRTRPAPAAAADGGDGSR
jgi:hypothetical protein